METTTFDELTRNLGSPLTRRSALRGLVASAAAVVTGGALLRAEDASAKKRNKKTRKKRQKRQKNNTPPVVICQNLGTACGLGASTLICNCRLTKEGEQTCANVVNPPNGATFEACILSSDCPDGQICDFGGNVCRTTCETA